jgi:hypothetical protein
MGITRRTLLGGLTASAATPFVGFAQSLNTQHEAFADPVLEAIAQEMLRLNVQLRHDIDTAVPHAGRYREFASLNRILDATMTAHDLKRHLRRVDTDEGRFPSTADHVAKGLTKRGFPISGDELMQHQQNNATRFLDLHVAKRDARQLIVSGHLFLQTAVVADSLAASLEQAFGERGIAFREGLNSPPARARLHTVQGDRLNRARACEAAGRWGFLLGFTGVGLALIPELALLGLIYAGAAVIFDGYVVFGC